MDKTFSIGDVARITGLPEQNLRYMEKNGYITKPDRIVSGSRAFRRYTGEEIENIIKLKSLTDQGFKLRIAVNKIKEETK